jgi:hypothetical protein
MGAQRRIEFQGRSFETGTICNALSCREVAAPHTGKPFSEALLLGVSGGITFGYMVFQYKGWSPHVALLTRNTFNPFQTIINRLGIIQETQETLDPKRGLANLIEALESGSAPVVWADVFSLPYTNLPSNGKIWAMMPLLVHAYDGQSFYVADRSKVSLKLSVEELMTARARVKKERFRLATFSPPDAKKLPEAVTAGIRQCIGLFDGIGAPRGHADDFGFAAYQKWAEMLVNTRNKQSWARIFSTGAYLFQALAGRTSQPGVFIWVMTWGAAPDAERGLFADFIEEAAQVLNKPKLLAVATQFRSAAVLWRTLAEAALPDSIPVLCETRELLLRQRELFIEHGQAAGDMRREICVRLDENARIAAETIESSSEPIRRLKSDLRARILQIHDAERGAVKALQDVVR